MPKIIAFVFCGIFLLPSHVFASEVLFKTGDAFIAEEVSEEAEYILLSWKDKKYKIPRSELQRIDPRKKGPDSSYRYSEFKLTDGTQLKGILIEKKENKLILKTELGFAELDKSKILSQNFDELSSEPPIIPEQYLLETSKQREWRIGVFGSGYYSWGAWGQAFPVTYGGGAFLERDTNSKFWFYGVSSEASIGKGKNGNLSIWSQSVYLGKYYGRSSPYWLLGAGFSNLTRTGEEKISAINPDLIFEFGWNWQTETRSSVRLGIRSQCSIEEGSSFCRSGLRFSWGFAI
ncbi:LA_3334 family protein [Leptospira sp. SA-E8]|uniref:LA_3334 family protein n=1 Tax=Leptospira sp. SA-E8 TaxID=3422259 RepID=UPI003EBD65EF